MFRNSCRSEVLKKGSRFLVLALVASVASHAFPVHAGALVALRASGGVLLSAGVGGAIVATPVFAKEKTSPDPAPRGRRGQELSDASPESNPGRSESGGSSYGYSDRGSSDGGVDSPSQSWGALFYERWQGSSNGQKAVALGALVLGKASLGNNSYQLDQISQEWMLAGLLTPGERETVLVESAFLLQSSGEFRIPRVQSGLASLQDLADLNGVSLVTAQFYADLLGVPVSE